MALVPLTRPTNMKNATLRLGATDTFEALTSVTLTPTPGGSVTLISGRVIKDPASWTLDINHIQDLAATGLTRYAYDHEGEEVDFELSCDDEADPIVGKVTIDPLAIGGAAGANAQSSASLAVTGKPAWGPVTTPAG